MKDEKTSRTVWNLVVPPHLDRQLEQYILQDAFKTKSEFIRCAVRDKLEKETGKMQT
jgi:Arc/MetJ-type ribon-helix-helix transcriptional regulator